MRRQTLSRDRDGNMRALQTLSNHRNFRNPPNSFAVRVEKIAGKLNVFVLETNSKRSASLAQKLHVF